MTREELIAALGAATADQQDECVRRSLRLAVAHGWISVETCERAMRMCDVGAYESAALVLVPEGMWWLIGAGRTRADEPLYGAVILWPGDNPKPPYACDEVGAGEHPTSQAIALCTAALKAQGGGA